MVDVTDAAVETLANDLANIYRGSPGLMKDRMLVVARHVITRQPGPEDVERIAAELQSAVGPKVQFTWKDVASAILALYPAPAAPVRTPTRSALDSALDPMLGNTPVRKAVVDAVLGLFEGAPKEHSTTDMEDRLATVLSQRSSYKADRDIANARVATLEAELAAAQMSATDLKNLDEVVAILGIEDSTTTPAEAVFELHKEIERLRSELAATPPPGTIRLGEGLTEAKIEQIGKIVDCDMIGVESGMFIVNGKALKNRHGDDHFVSTMEVSRLLRNRGQAVRNALRASATKNPEAVDWTQYAQEYIGGARSFDPDIIMTGLCEQIAALRAGGV